MRATKAAAAQHAATLVAAHAVIGFTKRGDHEQEGVIRIGGSAIPGEKGRQRISQDCAPHVIDH